MKQGNARMHHDSHAHGPAHPQADAEAAARAVRTRRFALGVVLVLAILGAGYYQFRSMNEQNAPVITRTGFDFVLTWKCLDCGHEKRDPGGVGPAACPKCGKESFYPHVRYACGQHGSVPVAFKYDEKGKPQQVRVPGGEWLPQHNEDWSSNTVCPTCKAEMMPAERMVPVESK